MARDLYQGQSSSFCLCLLHQSQISRLLLPLFQGRRALPIAELAGQGHSSGLRAAEEPIPRHAGSVQWVQVDVHQHAGQSEVNQCSSVQCTIPPLLRFLFRPCFSGVISRDSEIQTKRALHSPFLPFCYAMNLIHLVIWSFGDNGHL